MPELIIIEFFGGHRDGAVLRSKEKDFDQAHEAWTIFLATDRGTIGRGIRSLAGRGSSGGPRHIDPQAASDERKKYHQYLITDRVEFDGTVWLAMTYQLVRD